MTRFVEFLKGEQPTEGRLNAFLAANPEWVRLEFKEAKQVPIHGLRKSVAALASTNGGDLFIGVRDDGAAIGCSFDPSELAAVLRQDGSPAREDTRTNLLEVVGDPKQIPIEGGNRVYWFDVPEFGWIVAALGDDGKLHIYDRPGANSSEAVGLEAVDLYNRQNRARLLRAVFEESQAIENVFQPVFQADGFINDDTVARLRRLVSGREWDKFALVRERGWIQSESHLALFLRLPQNYTAWGKMVGQPGLYQRQQQEMILTKNRLKEALGRIRSELETERILPKS
jgi:hypothetical protein